MRKVQGDGVPYRKHLEMAAKRGFAPAIKELEGPYVPAYMEYIWGYFITLDRNRGEGMSGAQPITYEQIDAWNRLLDIQVKPYEVEALILLDLALRHPEAFVDA